MTQRVAKVAVPFVYAAAVALAASGCVVPEKGGARHRPPQNDSQQDTTADIAPADDLPPPDEPWLAEPGNWAADFNDLQIACYRGSMSACDSIWLNERVLMDTWLHDYGFRCGNRIRADDGGDADRLRYRLYDVARCVEIFPGHD